MKKIDKSVVAATIATFLGTVMSAAMYIKDKQTFNAVLLSVFGTCFGGTVAHLIAKSIKKQNEK